MIMQNAKSGDQFGVNFNFNFVLLQIKEITEPDYDEARIKLTVNDVDELIDYLTYYREKVQLWKEIVGDKRENESEQDYNIRIIQAAQENNYFIGPQEA
jgi:hypothetical protein